MSVYDGTSSPWNDSTRSFNDDSSDEDEVDWEEVNVPAEPTFIVENEDPSIITHVGPSKPIEITLDSVKKRPQGGKKTPINHAERIARLQTHKIHTICLISNGWIRNKYLNDRLLHARLMSLTPLALQMAFTQIHKKREPDAKRRGRLFEAAVMRLTQWWTEVFFDTEPQGSGEVQSRTFDEVAAELSRKRSEGSDDDEACELIRSCKSLQKHVLLRYGSRDLTAQLFTALCRALGIPARLIVSIQSVPWKASVGKPKPSYRSKKKGKQKAEPDDDDSDDDEPMAEVNIPVSSHDLKGKGKALFPGSGQIVDGDVSSESKGRKESGPIIKLRKQRPKGRRLGTTKRSPGPPLGGYPPAQWTEVFSRPDGRWLSVDPIRGFVDKRKMFEPPPHDKRNRMVYVLAFEEDGWVRDVTQRYAREFNNKTSKIRVGGKGKKEWWENVMAFLTRPYRLHRDDVEDAELESRQLIEGMPTSVAAFKDHPIYVLERHLHRDETLHPRVELGRFRGEPVFARANVVSDLKTAENWMRTGRVVKEGEQAMKWVKVRASTVGRKRAIGMAADIGQGANTEAEGAMQGLYAESQTELYYPPPVVNGKVPKNDFGNIDLYVDTMLPSGAVHIPYKGVAKVARDLGFDYAEAVTGFEFKNRRAFPIITGVVIAAENEQALLEAYWESAQDAEEKERIKREERILKRWTRLVQGLRIRKRLQEQYASQPPGTTHAHGADNREDIVEPEAGGFLLETADNVVQAYTLPKPLHIFNSLLNNVGSDEVPDEPSIDAEVVDRPRLDEADSGHENVEGDILPTVEAKVSIGVPKTMQQLAEMAEADAQELAKASPLQATIISHDTTGQSRLTRARGVNARESSVVRTSSRRVRKRARSSSSSEAVESDVRPKHKKAMAMGTSTPTASIRTLRPRVPKSDERKQRERELEQAYRRAIEE